MKHSRKDESKRRLRGGRYAAAAFVTALALVLTLIAPGTAGDGGVGDRSGAPPLASVSRADAASDAALSDGGGEASGSSDADRGKAPGTAAPDEEDRASEPAAPDGDDKAPSDDKPSKKTKEERTPKERAAAEREIERKTVEPEPGEEHEGYIVVMSDDGGTASGGDDGESGAEASLVATAEAAEETGYSASASGRYVRVEEPLDALDFAEASAVKRILPNYAIRPAAYPDYPDGANDTYWNYQKNYWPLEATAPDIPTAYGIGASALYKRGLSGAGISVGIFDTGLTYANNPDLRKDFAKVNGINFATIVKGSGPKTAEDYGYHGTAVAGFIASRVNNGKGVAGLTDMAEIFPYRVFNSKTGSFYTILYGLDYLLKNNELPDVINMSLGSESVDGYASEIFDDVAAEGTIVVAAAGNNTSTGTVGIEDFPSYPASFDSVISVANTHPTTGALHSTSHENAKVDVAAPGTSVYSLNYGSAGYVGTGTSYSSPQVAGVAVAVKQIDPSADVYAFRHLIEQTSRKIGGDTGFSYVGGYSKSYGYGLIDAEAILSYLEQSGLYRIRYDLNGGYIDKSYVPVSYATAGAFARGVQLPGAGSVKRGGYTFGGWYVNDEETAVTSLSVSNRPVNPGDAVELTARWVPNANLKASDFSITYGEARKVDNAYYSEESSLQQAATATYAALAGAKTGPDDKVAEANLVSYEGYLSKISSPRNAEGVYIIELITEKGALAHVAMTVYDSSGDRAVAVAPTHYDSASGGASTQRGAAVIADTGGITLSLSEIADADISGMVDAKAFTWSRTGKRTGSVGASNVVAGGLEGVTAPGTYAAWVAPKGHESDAKLTFSVLVTDDRQNHLISFNAPEAASGVPDAISIGHNQTIPALQTPVRPGYEFIGWYIDGTNTPILSGTPYSYDSDVTVTAKWRAKSFSIQAGSPVRYAPVGESVSLKAEFSGGDLTPDDRAVNWAIVSYGGTAATIDADTGLLTAGSKEGVAIVRVTSAHLPYIFDELAVIVAQPVEKVSMPLKKICLNKGDSFSVNASAHGAKSASVKFTWSSSNGNVATVTASGKVKAQGNGTAVVTAKSMNGKSSSVTVKVVDKAMKVEKVRVGGYSKTMKRGRTAQLKVSVSPSNAVFTKVRFTSSKPSVLSVDEAGKLTAKKKGVATVTVKVGKKSQKIKIRVK